MPHMVPELSGKALPSDQHWDGLTFAVRLRARTPCFPTVPPSHFTIIVRFKDRRTPSDSVFSVLFYAPLVNQGAVPVEQCMRRKITSLQYMREAVTPRQGDRGQVSESPWTSVSLSVPWGELCLIDEMMPTLQSSGFRTEHSTNDCLIKD